MAASSPSAPVARLPPPPPPCSSKAVRGLGLAPSASALGRALGGDNALVVWSLGGDVSARELARKTTAELRAMCRDAEVSTAGTKGKMAHRIMVKVRETKDKEHPPPRPPPAAMMIPEQPTMEALTRKPLAALRELCRLANVSHYGSMPKLAHRLLEERRKRHDMAHPPPPLPAGGAPPPPLPPVPSSPGKGNAGALVVHHGAVKKPTQTKKAKAMLNLVATTLLALEKPPGGLEKGLQEALGKVDSERALAVRPLKELWSMCKLAGVSPNGSKAVIARKLFQRVRELRDAANPPPPAPSLLPPAPGK